MIEGCLRWQREGLEQPPAVAAATASYLEAEDALGIWIDEKCVRGNDKFATSAKLFESWRYWAELAGEFVGTQKSLGMKLETRGLTPARDNKGVRGFRGIALIELQGVSGAP